MIPCRRPFTSQPQGALEIDWSNPMSRGLFHCSMPGLSDRNIANGKPASYIGTGTKKATRAGNAKVFSSSINHRMNYVSPYSSGDMTILSVTTPASGSAGGIFGVFNLGNVNAISNYISIESGPNFSAVSTDGSNWSIATGPAPVANIDVVLCGTFKAGGARVLYVDGFLKAQNATGRNPSGLTDIIEGCYNGGSASGYLSPFNGSISLSLIFNRVLLAPEVFALSVNPWQIFNPRTFFLGSLTQPQILYPTGDVAGGAWLPSTGTDLFACLDETAASDADYIYTTVHGAYQEFSFADGGAVDPSTGGHVRYRLPAGTGTITAILKQGSTTLQTLGTHTLTGSAQDIDVTITASTANSTDLRVGFTSSA